MSRVEFRFTHSILEAAGVNSSVFTLLLVPLLRKVHKHEDLGVPLFVEHIRAITASFDSKLAEVDNPLLPHLSRCLR